MCAMRAHVVDAGTFAASKKKKKRQHFSNMRPNPNLFFLSLILLFLNGCTFYGKVGNFEECKDYYDLSQKNYKTIYSEEEITNSWEQDGWEIFRDTVYSKNGKWMGPQTKILNYQHSEIKAEINYIFFQILNMRKTEIKIHGICLKEKMKIDLSTKDLKKINELIRIDFIDKFRKK